MKRLLGVPALDHFCSLVVAQLEKLMSLGGAVPLAFAALLVYVFLIAQQRRTTAS